MPGIKDSDSINYTKLNKKYQNSILKINIDLSGLKNIDDIYRLSLRECL